MKKIFFKYISIIASYSIFFIISVYTFNIYVPKEIIPEIFPEKTNYKLIHEIPTEEKKLEIYSIIKPKNEVEIKRIDEDVNINDNLYFLDMERKSNNLQLYKLQLGSFKNKDKAINAYEEIHKRYSSIFKEKKPLIEKKEIPYKGIFFRIKSQDLFDKVSAKKICEILIHDNLSCLIVKNSNNE